jgi:serine/threonine-protein phosphatase CPPED1
MMTTIDHLTLPDLQTATPWLALDRFPKRPQEFSFVLLSDRTGLAKPGVFERAVQGANMLRPDFAIQVGDCIEGYTRNPETLATQWAEFEAITSALDVPLFRVPGNHDVSNAMMRDEWLRRYGALYYHFRYRDVLFLVIDTQDPPQRLAEFRGAQELPGAEDDVEELDMEKVRHAYDADPRAFAARVETAIDWEGTQPAHISLEQTEWAAEVIAEHADVRWTILCMHIPAWQGDGNPALARIRRALGGRPYTAFAGHVHNYQRRILDGREHIRLGPTGGAWVQTKEEGSFDHITWVTMTETGPRIANIVLDGILGAEGGVFRPTPMFATLAQA